MGTPVALCRKSLAVLLTALLAFTLVPFEAFAEGEDSGVAPTETGTPSPEGEASGSPAEASVPAEGSVEDASASAGSLLASTLLADGTHVISVDVAFDGAPVTGSFTVDGLTYALSDDGVTLVAVTSGALGVDGSDGGRGEVPPSGTSFASGSAEPSAPSGPSEIPSMVAYGGIDYDVVAIGAYAFYLSRVTEVELPATIASVDERAFRSSDVERVEVDPANPTYASFDGCLYDSQFQSLLLIPEGRAGSVSIPCEAEVITPSLFSHCSLVTSISVDGDGAAFASWEGLLYDAPGTTLLRVPAGATDITIREGCTTIAAGAMEGCAKLETIDAPSTVTSISPDAFSQETPTVSLPVASLVEKGEGDGTDGPSQLTAMVALTAGGDPAPKVDPAAIAVTLPDDAPAAPWQSAGLKAEGGSPEPAPLASSEEGEEDPEPELPAAALGSAEAYAGSADFTIVNAEGATLYQTNSSGSTNKEIDSRVIGCGSGSHQVHVRFLDKGGSLIVQLWHSATSDDSYYRWVKPGYVLVGVKVTNGAGTVTDEIRADNVGTSYAGASKITGAGRTIAPIFEKIAYSVTLNSNGATTAGTTSVSVQYGQAMPAITIPALAGKKFMGYYASSNPSSSTKKFYDEKGKSARNWDQCETYPTSLSTTVNYTLYARWVTSVTVQGNGGTLQVSRDKASTLYGERTPVEPSFTTSTYVLEGPVTIYNNRIEAWWEDKVDGVWYYTQVLRSRSGYRRMAWSGSGIEVKTTDTKTASLATGSISAIWCAGPVFDANGGKVYASSGAIYDDAGRLPKTNDSWSNNVQSFTLSAGSVVVNRSSGASATNYLVKRDGYRCLGWSESKTASSASVTSVSFETEKTFYAVWEPQVTVDMQGGTANVIDCDAAGTQTKFALESNYAVIFSKNGGVWLNSGGEGTIRVTAVSRAGYRFCGWSTNKNCAYADAANYVWFRSSGPLTIYAIWEPMVTIDMNGGTATLFEVENQSKVTHAYTGRYMDFNKASASWDHSGYIFATKYSRDGYRFCGWSTDKGCKPADAGSLTWTGAEPLTIYAIWEPMVTIDMNGGTATLFEVENQSKVTHAYTGRYMDFNKASASWDHSGYIFATKYSRDGYRFCGWSTNKDCAPSDAGDYHSWTGVEPLTIYAIWEMSIFNISYDLNGGSVSGNLSTYTVETDTFALKNPARQGYIFAGWSGTGLTGEANMSVTIAKGSTGDRSYAAHWTPALSADVPVEVTARVDILGVEEPTEATGYIESRSGGALEVAEVGFTPLAGAAELFGSRTADVFLEAFAEGSASADYRFSLDAAAVETDVSKLAPFALPDGYGTRIGVGYRFAIPDDVLSSIELSRFEQQTTPVGQVVYTVALAS